MAYPTDSSKRRAASFWALPLLAVLLLGLATLTAGCGESFLAPEPKSFLTPENTFTSQQGLQAVLTTSNKQLRSEYYGAHQPILTEYYFTDLGVSAGGSQETVWPRDMSTQITPTGDVVAKINEDDGYWSIAYDAISNANTLLANLNNVTDWSSEEDKNAMRAAGYFHRAYWYYRLTQQFGDVPVYLSAIEGPRLDFNTFSREAILMKMRDDLEASIDDLPMSAGPGQISQAAGYYLLTKIYLALRQFQDAADAASQVIDGGPYALMTERFGQGPYAGDPRFNVLWDLHQKENKSSGANTEVILAVQDKFGLEGSSDDGTQITRYVTPAWWNTPVTDPNGFSATVPGPEGNPFSDSLGRGIGGLRTSPYFNYTLWEGDEGDLRHSDVNWFSLDDFYYNNPESEYYGEPFVRAYIGDTTRTWYPFMYNKVYVPDEAREHRKQGGHSDWYVYRLAGLYLLRAEAYYWMGQMGQAAEDINAVRERAEAPPITAAEVTIDSIFDERARELYLEAPRKTEMTRVAYIMAQLGREGYSLENMESDNWYYDRVMEKNVYYGERIPFSVHQYTVEPHNVYWPIPQSEIDSNIGGQINQTPGYVGAESNQEPLGYEAIQQLAEGEEEDSDGSGASGS